MKKSYKLTNLDCANCAAKMESAINKFDGVNKATVSFMTQKLTLDVEDSKFVSVLKQTITTINKIEPDCKINIK